MHFGWIEVVLLACTSVSIALLLGLWRQERRAQRRLQELEMGRLKGQLTPHFLFNALNGICELGYEDPEAADRAITRLSGLLRKSLEDGDRQEITVKAEFDFLEDYLALQRMLQREGLNAQIELDPAAEYARVPAMILQPLVENALTHGRQDGVVDVRISARRNGRILCLEVRDHGPGPQPLAAGVRVGIGLANTRARLAHVCGAEANMDLIKGQDGGALARITLPFRQIA